MFENAETNKISQRANTKSESNSDIETLETIFYPPDEILHKQVHLPIHLRGLKRDQKVT